MNYFSLFVRAVLFSVFRALATKKEREGEREIVVIGFKKLSNIANFQIESTKKGGRRRVETIPVSEKYNRRVLKKSESLKLSINNFQMILKETGLTKLENYNFD